MIGEMHYHADRERPSRVERLFLSSPDSFGQSLLSGLTLFASPLAFRSSQILSRGISIRKVSPQRVGSIKVRCWRAERWHLGGGGLWAGMADPGGGMDRRGAHYFL